ncbi:unnamed protein product, partial [Prorocentrum cordatum]
APAALAGPAAEAAPLRGARPRAAAAGSGLEGAPATPVEREALAAFRTRYPAQPLVFELLAQQPADVQAAVLSDFRPRPEGLADYTELLEYFISWWASFPPPHRSAAKRQPAPALVRSHQVAPAASTEEDQLAAFRERYPVDGTAFDLLAKQPVDVKSMVISKFYPPNVMSDYSTMLTKCVQAITKASRGSLQVATFSTGCFWKSQQLFDAVSGVVNTTVGYTGGNTKREPTHESVQLGDGHSEAIRVEFDPELITYDALLIHFDRIRRLTPAPVGLASAGRAIYHTTARESGTTTQHHSAVWYHNEKQAEVLREHCKQTDPDFHVARMTRWHDAEDYHQKFYQKGCSVQ